MQAKLFFKNAVILIAGSFFMRALGVAFGAYLSGKMGAEGMGLFQLTATVYGLASTFATSGIYLSVTRLVAEELAAGSYAGADDAMRKCMRYGLIVSLLAAIGLFWLAEPIGTVLLGDARTVLSLKILALALPFMAFSSSLRGYFFALRMAGKSSGGQIVEQLAHMAVAIGLFTAVVPEGDLTLACAAAAGGCLGGELISFLFSLILYLRDRRKWSFVKTSSRDITRRMVRITLPVALSSYLKSTLRTIENLLVPRGLRKYGASGSGALAQYGMTEAMVMPILTFPTAFLTSFSSLLVPEIAEAQAVGDNARISRLVSKVVRYTLLFAAAMTGVFVFFAEELGWAVYRQEGVGSMLGLLAPLVPLMYLDNVADSMLKGMDEQVSVLRYSICDSAVSICLLWFLLPIYGVNGYIFVMFASTFLNATLSFARLASVTCIRIHLVQWIVKPVLCVSGACLCANVLINFANLSAGWDAAARIGAALGLYFLFLCATGTFTREDFRWFYRVFHPDKPESLRPAKSSPAPRSKSGQ
ncbi:MAG TPA: oligosaccharide flippase family protein [Candidatus Merdivicinus intestinigallinarum]|nr:oligosaccharide flippase family protein [Candidatus Merdivicinus intestinigallinarum]